MKRAAIFSILVLLFGSCQEENPTVDSFIQYDNPHFVSIDGDKLEELNQEIKNGSFGDIHSLLILRDDKIVFENYYDGHNREEVKALGSATQSIVSTLVGIMLKEHPEISIRDKIINFFPEYASLFDDIPQKDQIELRHLMSHTSGFSWSEWGKSFGDMSNSAYAMSISDDWIETVLSTSMAREPGFEFNFNSGNGVLMSPIIKNITGMDLGQYAQEKLFGPLNIVDWNWEKIPGDIVNASWGLHMKPMDMAKIGYLFLKEGTWEGQQLFNEDWRQISSRSRASITGYYNYGYFWWRFSNSANVLYRTDTNDIFFFWGDGGQFLFIIPHLDMVIVTTADNNVESETNAIVMLRDYILGSLVRRYP